ncbi:MAG: DUF4381 domain-containing protein [Pseudomonadota bacterium]|nr:DUF4381 domain-containing protein [Pseudomonadota bacterium]
MNPAEQTLQLRDVHLPASPEFWPPAPGWWIVALLAVAILCWLAIRLISFWRRKRAQREIFLLLDDLSKTVTDDQIPEFLASVSTLLRRVALLKYPRKEVAALTGKGWLSFLDMHGGEGDFVNGAGSVLEAGPYMHKSNVDKEGLLQLARKWIERNTRVI